MPCTSAAVRVAHWLLVCWQGYYANAMYYRLTSSECGCESGTDSLLSLSSLLLLLENRSAYIVYYLSRQQAIALSSKSWSDSCCLILARFCQEAGPPTLFTTFVYRIFALIPHLGQIYPHIYFNSSGRCCMYSTTV